MAGHNKWAKVKYFKGAIDAKRGEIFSKLSREITIASHAPVARRERSPHE